MPEEGMANALETFERTFSYPLGVGRTFSISHGEDYPRFFRAISVDASASFVAANESGAVLGTLGVALRRLRFPDGECRLAAYLGDLKTAPGPGRGRILLRLAAEAARWSTARGAVAGYGVVMDGTLKTPVHYTGRVGMHAFREVGKISVLRLPAETCDSTDESAVISGVHEVEDCFLKLSSGKFAPLNGGASREREGDLASVAPLKWHRHPACGERGAGVPPASLQRGQDARAHLTRRSAIDPLPLLAQDGSACGVLEDTRLAKRLIGEDGQEMRAAHLSCFAYKNPQAGVSIVRHVLALCARNRVAPAMFVAIPWDDLEPFKSMLDDIRNIVIAPATVYGTGDGMPEGEWLISTAEI